MSSGPMGPATDLLSDVRFELMALNEQIAALRSQVAEQPAPVVNVNTPEVSVQPAVEVDFGPLLGALAQMERADDRSELAALRKEFSDLAISIRAIAGNSGGTAGIGASVVNPGADFPVINSATSALHVTVDGTATVTDFYTTPEILADQAGAGAQLTFTFTTTPKLVWVKSSGGNARAVVGAGTATSSFGIPCDDGVPQPISVQAQTVKVYAPAGATVSVWGFS